MTMRAIDPRGPAWWPYPTVSSSSHVYGEDRWGRPWCRLRKLSRAELEAEQAALDRAIREGRIRLSVPTPRPVAPKKATAKKAKRPRRPGPHPRPTCAADVARMLRKDKCETVAVRVAVRAGRAFEVRDVVTPEGVRERYAFPLADDPAPGLPSLADVMAEPLGPVPTHEEAAGERAEPAPVVEEAPAPVAPTPRRAPPPGWEPCTPGPAPCAPCAAAGIAHTMPATFTVEEPGDPAHDAPPRTVERQECCGEPAPDHAAWCLVIHPAPMRALAERRQQQDRRAVRRPTEGRRVADRWVTTWWEMLVGLWGDPDLDLDTWEWDFARMTEGDDPTLERLALECGAWAADDPPSNLHPDVTRAA